MGDNINVQQLKEFFEFRADMQDKAIKATEDKVDSVASKVGIMVTKVDTMWKAVLGIVATMALGILKAFGVY